MPRDLVWKPNQSDIRETIFAETWNQEDWKTTLEEQKILSKINLEQGMVSPQMSKALQTNSHIHIHFSCLTEGFIKLNFDGTSKGNPGIVGLGGLFTEWSRVDKMGVCRPWRYHEQ